MRIELQYGPQPTSGSSTSAAATTTSQSPSDLGIGEDQTQLSGTYTQSEALTGQALELPELRQEKVAALRQSVQAGEYRPAAEQVANALLSHVLTRAAA